MARVTTPPADASLDRDSPYAEPSARLAAFVLDAALPAVPQITLMALGVAFGSGTWIRASHWLGWALTVLFFVADVVLLARYGQTVGKRIIGLRIVRTDGSRASLGRLFWLRWVIPSILGFVPLLGWLFGLADALTVFSDDRRTLHDRIADTIVIDLRAAPERPSLAEVFS